MQIISNIFTIRNSQMASRVAIFLTFTMLIAAQTFVMCRNLGDDRTYIKHDDVDTFAHNLQDDTVVLNILENLVGLTTDYDVFQYYDNLSIDQVIDVLGRRGLKE